MEVNGIIQTNAAHGLIESDKISLDNEALVPQKPIYLMLNKPVGFICANTDPDSPTVIDLIRTGAQAQQNLSAKQLQSLQIVGRLDKDTTGLVLLTDDGAWNHKVSSPRHKCEKTYHVQLANTVTENDAMQFKAGIQLKDNTKATLPAELEILEPQKVILKIMEGRYHQVKRMFAATGNKVTRLHRSAIGDIQLDQNLAEGECRYLSANEVQSLAEPSSPLSLEQ